MTSYAAKALGFTPTSISRAVKELEKPALIQTKKRGVQKIITSDYAPEELMEKAGPYLSNPVKRKIYVPFDTKDDTLLKSGYSALSEYTMLNPPNVPCYASGKISKWPLEASNNLQDASTQIAVELWRYDPHKLAKENTVDVLSLALSLKNNPDERVEEAVEEMLNELWRNTNGKRI